MTEPVQALKGLVAFSWIDAFMHWPGLFRLPTLLLLTAAVVLGPYLVGASFAQSAGLFVSLFMTGCSVAVFVILAAGFQRDLVQSGFSQLAQKLIPSRRIIRIGAALSLVLGVLSVGWFNWLFDGDALYWQRLFAADYYRSASVGEAVNWWLLTLSLLFASHVLVHLILYFLNQVHVALLWADQIEIDLTHMERCEVCSQPVMRYLLIVVILASLNILAYDILSNVGLGEGAADFLAPLMLFVLAGCYPVLKPLIVLRHRIADAKAREIEAVRLALTGSRDALAESQIAAHADDFRAPDLMSYEQQIKAIWEWPIQGDMQRILLYVFLPPLAWVLAALVEQVVDSMMYMR